ncbi:protein phosphatase 1 regulatory subunit 15A [Drosophila rhopaloa]|uniref:Protein phosphatase 1 regulatory subunit 15A n=1 Tax=Drosophila rhopaloa TaxID=1041015 RepID=A0A6P4FC19_DRORH|nr:protein phosphatase 1 regulatory subunit 15A [Drosophila rhopaloa]
MELAYNASSSAASVASASASASFAFTNTAKLPIETVKRLIAAVSRRPMLWLRNNANGQKRSDITPVWFEVGQDVNLPADICRIKWGHLRDNFRKVYIRNNLSNETPSSWRFYNDMRFMEPAVHENIMRQTRSSSKKHPPGHWTENNNVLVPGKYDAMPIVATEPICEISDSYDSELHQPSFSDISSFFEDRECHPPDSKRFKIEPNQAEDEEEEDDDDFDEDAASENLDEERGKRAETTNPGVYTIEVLDDDEEMEQEVTKAKSNNTSHSSSLKSEPEAKVFSNSQSPSSDLPFKYISTDAATNTDPTGGDLQDEADRMFLLSLMPFLQRLDNRRRLRVRQKLQNVLIEELEFG